MKLADYSDRVTADQLDTALRQGSFEGVFHYLHGTPGYVLRIELPSVVTAIRQRGWIQAGIDVPFNPGDANGGAMAQAAYNYEFPSGSCMYLDIEPSRFDAAPAQWPGAADAWCDGVRGGGFSPGIYGADRTVAACSNHADTIWRAKPGQCDPAGPGLDPTFFAGRRASQCSQENHNGVSFDVSYSQFELGLKLPKEIDMLMLHPPTGLGVLISGDLVVQLPPDGTTEALQTAGVQVVNVTQAFFDNVMSAAAVVQGSVKGSLNLSGVLNVARGIGA